MAFPIASRRSVSFPRGTRVTYVTWDVSYVQITFKKRIFQARLANAHVESYNFVFL